MLARVLSSAVMGIDAYIVEVELDISDGLPAFATVGLPDSAVKESRERVTAAIKNSGFLLSSQPNYCQSCPRRCSERGICVRFAHGVGRDGSDRADSD